MTQQAVAEHLVLSRDAAYQKYESGVVLPPPDKLVALADLFGVSTDYLLGREAEVDLTTLAGATRHLVQKKFAAQLAEAGTDLAKLEALHRRLDDPKS